jgi:hypothetical protein
MRYWTGGADRYGFFLDGGNIRLWWWNKSIDGTLEGSSFEAVHRRREQVRREADGADDD